MGTLSGDAEWAARLDRHSVLFPEPSVLCLLKFLRNAAEAMSTLRILSD